MQEEIFGPILPVLTFDDLSDVIHQLHNAPKPLAVYLFSNTASHQRRVAREVLAGGVCVNDTLGHFENDALPFGGVGTSGMGAYHGKASFDTFAHKKGVFRGTWVNDLKIQYAVEAGRAPEALQSCMYYGFNVSADARRATSETKEFLEAYYAPLQFPEDWLPSWAASGTAEQVIAMLREHIEAGADHITLRPTSWDQAGQVKILVEQILPALGDAAVKG